jgi:hypothetical protein
LDVQSKKSNFGFDHVDKRIFASLTPGAGPERQPA